MVAEKDGKRIAIEIETGKSDAIYNISKDIKEGFDEVISLPLNIKCKEKNYTELKNQDLDTKKRSNY